MEILTFKNVDFTYAGSSNPTLININSRFNKGEKALIIGRSGCGKTTLLRHMKKSMMPSGILHGEVLFQDQNLLNMDLRNSTQQIGYVQQNPDNQIVTDKVWHELSFGLENLGVGNHEIRRRVAEMAEYFGISSWYRKDVADLSGGQKQLLNLAAVMVMKPKLLVLDEPTAQLDPIAADRFLETVSRLNQELGTTIVITEHRVERIFSRMDKIIAMDHGKVICDLPPKEAADYLAMNCPELEPGLPSPVRIYRGVKCLDTPDIKLRFNTDVKTDIDISADSKAQEATNIYAASNDCSETDYHASYSDRTGCPLDVIEGQKWLHNLVERNDRHHHSKSSNMNVKNTSNRSDDSTGNSSNNNINNNSQIILQVKDVMFGYSKQTPLVLEHMNLSVREGTFLGILGGNGAGKSTLLKIIAGVRRPVSGKVKSKKRIVLLPQNPLSLFTEVSVEEELAEAVTSKSNTALCQKSRDEQIEIVNDMLRQMDLDQIRKQNPNDISGGQQQKLALAKVLLYQPEILLLDEPTKGLDPYFKEFLGEQLMKLNKSGITILMVSHDIEFCSSYTSECAFLFDRQIVTQDQTKRFFAGNTFYTTQANRIAGELFPDCVTCKDVVLAVQNLREERQE